MQVRHRLRLWRLIFVIPAALGLAPLALLTIWAETRAGRGAGVGALALLGGFIALAVSLVPRERPSPWAIVAAGLFVVGLVLFGVLANRPPLTHIHTTSVAGLRAFRVGEACEVQNDRAELIPEIDLVTLGATLATRLAPPGSLVDRGRIRSQILREYREIAADPTARTVRSVIAPALAELVGLRIDAGHYFAYVPASQPGERLPAIVFLHGNGGNLKAMPWAWRTFAERNRIVVVCPTFGFGFWGEGAAEAVESVRLDAIARLPIDPSRVMLGGLSDGGVGVTRVARFSPDRYQGLIYISPTMNRKELADPAFRTPWQGRPVLVLQGGRDANVPKSTVDPAVALLLAQGVQVTYHVFAEEDHFLFFGRREQVFYLIEEWLPNSFKRLPLDRGGQ